MLNQSFVKDTELARIYELRLPERNGKPHVTVAK